MGDISNNILLSKSEIVKEATYYKPAVKKYQYENNNYFVKEYRLSNDFQKNKLLKILITFEFLKYMDINIPEILTYYDKSENILKVLSKECGNEYIAELGILPNDKREQDELAKIIYTADLLGLGDIANDNILKGKNGLVLIDFDPIDNSNNSRFKPLDVFGKMGEENYSVAKSFDLHNTKGIIELLCEIPEFGSNTNLSINKNDKQTIEEKFFNLNRAKISEIINNAGNKYFKNILVDFTKIEEEFINRYEYVLKTRNKANTNINTEDYKKDYSEAHITKPLSKLLNNTYSGSFIINSTDNNSQDVDIYKDVEKENSSSFQEYIKNKCCNGQKDFDMIVEI